MKEELRKELEARGTAEISNGVVSQVTQAIDESETEVKLLIFGKLQEHKVTPVDETCSKCNFWSKYFKSTKACQKRQSEDARARGFSKLVCPHQLS